MRIKLFRPLSRFTQPHESIEPWKKRRMIPVITFLLTLALTLCLSASAFAQHYQQTNLVSDVPGLAAQPPDPHLVNSWGLARSATSPWWVADNGTGLATLYNGAGVKLALEVTIPVPPGGTPPSTPTGAVFNGSSDFLGDRFIFVTEDGTISGWSGGTSAVLRKNFAGSAIYKGVTIAQNEGTNFLYAANFFAGTVDVFDKNYMPFNLGASAFSDTEIPSGFAPFNVQNIEGRVFVTFAKQGEGNEDEVDGPGLGFVDEFDAAGNLLLRLRSGPWMNAPWGVALAPSDFGKLSNRLLVGQFGSGQIASFDPGNGNFHGLMRGLRGQPLTIDGLWALRFGNGAAAGPTNTLFFTAGIDDEHHGLFGTITPVKSEED